MQITAYYFRAHSYTIVPHQVRDDMAWMADHGTNAVCIGILEQDLYAAVENYQLVCEEAGRAGMEVFATPSRWGALVAGCPKVPSIFCATHPEAMVQNADGSPHIGWLGPVASVHHPAWRSEITLGDALSICSSTCMILTRSSSSSLAKAFLRVGNAGSPNLARASLTLA